MMRLREQRILLWLVLLGIGVGQPRADAHAGAEMATAASAWLESLSDAQLPRAGFPFASDERERWSFLPSEMFPRSGVMLKDLDSAQRTLARDLLRTGLSERGYLAASAIIELERVLQTLSPNGRFVRDPGNYYLSIFGSPDAKGTWGWRFEGHHLSLHFTIAAGQTTVSSPTFFGANPAEVREGPARGTRPLAGPDDAGRRLFVALTKPQRALALISETAPSDIVTGTSASVGPLTPDGIAAASLSQDQRALLREAIEASTALMAEDVAAQRWARIRNAGEEKIAFAWAGAAVRGEPHYYRIQGPTFLIEYDNTQNGANHIHLVWREFNGDFGRDVLREHLGHVSH